MSTSVYFPSCLGLGVSKRALLLHRCLPGPPSLPPGPPLSSLCTPIFTAPLPAATFVFQNPAIFEASSELGDITGLYMNDDEGTITVSTDTPASQPHALCALWPEVAGRSVGQHR